MTLLNSQERELVALGAAMGSNCVSCIEHHIPASRKAGLTDSQIAEAIRLANRVRQVPARKALETALHLLADASGTLLAENETGATVARLLGVEETDLVEDDAQRGKDPAARQSTG